jgi:hypothetical protein
LIGAPIRERVPRLYLFVNTFETETNVVVAFEKLAARVARETIKNVVLARLSFLSRVIKDCFAAHCFDALLLVCGGGDTSER